MMASSELDGHAPIALTVHENVGFVGVLFVCYEVSHRSISQQKESDDGRDVLSEHFDVELLITVVI